VPAAGRPLPLNEASPIAQPSFGDLSKFIRAEPFSSDASRRRRAANFDQTHCKTRSPSPDEGAQKYRSIGNNPSPGLRDTLVLSRSKLGLIYGKIVGSTGIEKDEGSNLQEQELAGNFAM
jgi:hypothetical protein